MKLNLMLGLEGNLAVAPLTGAWIEMDASRLCPPTTASPPSRGAWIEIGFPLRFYWKP